MTPAQAIAELEGGKARPVYVVLGEERVFADRVVAAARKHVVEAAMAGFNVDVFEAGEAKVERVLDAANTMPMMARRRLVVLRGLERLDKGGDDEPKDKAKGHPTDRLAEYVQSPSPSACLVIVATKLDGRRKLSGVAKKAGVVVECAPLAAQQLTAFVRDEAKRRGNPIGADVAEALVDVVGNELAWLIDAVERLSLYAGQGQPITEEAVHACVARVHVSKVFDLSDAVAARDRAKALRVLHENYDHSSRGLPLHALMANALRKLLRVRALIEGGMSGDEAASAAGIHGFKARDTVAQARRFRPGELERAIAIFAEADLALKGSKRHPLLVLEEAIVRLTS